MKDRNAIIDELIDLQCLRPPDEDEFTVSDYIARYIERTGGTISGSTARRQLTKLVNAGKLSRRKAMQDGVILWAFKPISNTK